MQVVTSPPTDPDSLARSVEGVVKMHASWAYRRRVKPAGGRPEDFEDLVSAGWRGVAVALSRWRAGGGACFGTFAFRGSRNHVLREAQRICQRLRLAADPFPEWDEGDAAGQVPDRRGHPGYADGVERILAATPSIRGRRILLLRAVFGWQFNEIGAELGVTKQAAEMAYRRVVGECRRRLGRAA